MQCFQIQFLEDCIVWDHLSSKNLEVVSLCNSGSNILLAQSIYNVKLGLVPL